MIYAASSPSVAQLEYLCIKGNAVANNHWYMIVYEIANHNLIGEMDKSYLPDDWNILPRARSTQEFGRDWLLEREYPFLKVPSARINLAFYPEQHNLLINPDFADLQKALNIREVLPFDYLLG